MNGLLAKDNAQSEGSRRSEKEPVVNSDQKKKKKSFFDKENLHFITLWPKMMNIKKRLNRFFNRKVYFLKKFKERTIEKELNKKFEKKY